MNRERDGQIDIFECVNRQKPTQRCIDDRHDMEKDRFIEGVKEAGASFSFLAAETMSSFFLSVGS